MKNTINILSSTTINSKENALSIQLNNSHIFIWVKPTVIRIILFSSLVIFYAGQCFGESKKDSLINICYSKQVSDLNKIPSFLELSKTYFNETKYDSAQLIAKQGLKLALSNPYAKNDSRVLDTNIAELYLTLGTILYTVSELDGATKNWFQSLKYYDRLNDAYGRSMVLTNIANLQIDHQDFSK